MVLGTDVGRSKLAMPDLVPGGARWRAGSARGDVSRGRPVPWQEVADPPGGMIREPGQYVGEPGLRVDAVELRGLDQGVDRRRSLPTAIRAGERPVAPPDGHCRVILPMSGRRSW